MSERSEPCWFHLTTGERLAFHLSVGKFPAVVYFPGFNSVMSGRKVRYLEAQCVAAGRAFLRFDYRGHGRSSGELVAGSIADWIADSSALLDHLGVPSYIAVGASMGTWVALRLAALSPVRVRGLLGIGAGVDFSGQRFRERLSEAQWSTLQREGITWRPSRYGDGPYPLTRRMVADGERNLVLNRGLELAGPLELVHGMADPDVPWTDAVAVLEGLDAPSANLLLIKDGDHRLSRAGDLRLLGERLSAIISWSNRG